MAEPQLDIGDSQRLPRSPQNGSDGDDGPSDLETALALIAEQKKQIGRLANDNKTSKTKLTEAARLTEALKKYAFLEESGLKPEDIQALLDSRNDGEREKARASGDFDKMLKDARAAAEKERDAAFEAKKKSDSRVERVFVDDALRRELERYVEPDYLDAVFAWKRPQVEALEDEDSDYGIRAVHRVGDDVMSVGEFVKNWAETDEKAAPFLKRSLAAGGGASGSGSIAGRLRFARKSEMDAAAISNFIRTHPGGPEAGAAAYRALPK